MGRRLFGTIRKLPSGRYQARYLDATGRRHQARSTVASKGDAGRWLSDVEAAIARGTWIDPDAGRVLLADYAQGWTTRGPVCDRAHESCTSRCSICTWSPHSAASRSIASRLRSSAAGS